MKRSTVGLVEVADWETLVNAAGRAGQGKRSRPEVGQFFANLDQELQRLRDDILSESLELSPPRQFRIRDPKTRLIHAPSFRERVFHHAVIAHIGPLLDRALVYDTYACRLGRGASAAEAHVQRYAWYGKLDVQAYFASIDHGLLLNLLARRLKDPGLLRLCTQLIAEHPTPPGRGLPIGALTSQHFANYYLSGLDRWLLETCHVHGMVRYMDDVIWWGPYNSAVQKDLHAARDYLAERLALSIHEPGIIQRSAAGVTFCGYRILPGQCRLSLRRRRRYTALRAKWEARYATGEIDTLELQRAYAAVLGSTLHAEATAWRRRQLQLHPPNAACAAL